MSKKNVIIIGAAGRDFHNFNTYYRNNDAYNVVAFTAAQIPDIEGRKYPAELAGSLYPQGIPIYAEEDLSKLIKELEVDDCVFAYSDVPYQHVMSVGARKTPRLKAPSRSSPWGLCAPDAVKVRRHVEL
jgi:predicted GTPase